MVSVIGVILNIIMVISTIILIIMGLAWNAELKICETKQSSYCYTINCPCDSPNELPCKGYAKMPGPKPGQWYCFNHPMGNNNTVLVDDNGNTIK